MYKYFLLLQNFVEFYDVGNDPHQMYNIINELHLKERNIFNSLLQNLTVCVGAGQCSNVNF